MTLPCTLLISLSELRVLHKKLKRRKVKNGSISINLASIKALIKTLLERKVKTKIRIHHRHH